ncbi:MAG: class I SAM-dependent methyltransferase [Selenomonadaceae bacterium]|nr:class I SAM-dependent methyltransferase [Selenomonadaceae bacterium]
MQNDWQKIWNKREDRFDEIDLNNEESVFMELKRLDGFDLTSGITYKAWMSELERVELKLGGGGQQIFEVGCGSGANLYKFRRNGFEIGGLDYSQKLLDSLKKILKPNDLRELICDEAINLPTEIQYDASISFGVFEYFSSIDYAREVLEKMSKKSRKMIALLEIYDESKREDFFELRRSMQKDYDERYKNLPKQFYPRKFFEDFASEHGFSIEFEPSTLEGYWNNEFVFHCYIRK